MVSRPSDLDPPSSPALWPGTWLFPLRQQRCLVYAGLLGAGKPHAH